MTSINSIQSLVLDLPPSCIEFCPEAPSYFVVGTYFLEKKEQDESADAELDDGEDEDEITPKEAQKRSGSLILFQVIGDEVKQVSTTPTPYAILDIHFSPHDPSLLCVAASTGLLEIFRFTPTTTTLALEKTIQLFDPSILVLSLAWHPTNANLIGVTVSNGEVYICDMSAATSTSSAEDNSAALTEIQQHDLEAWTLAFAPSGESLFSGGDDAKLIFADGVLAGETGGLGVQWSDRRIHGAGVTAILPLGHEDNVTVTGSYDDHIRVLYTPKMGRKQVLAEENLEGGVWRLKVLKDEHEVGRYTLLASCMHAGTHIVQIQRAEDGQWHIVVLAKFEEHKSMNYGSDFRPGDANLKTIVSTSFYDKLLCLWRFESC